MVADTMIRQAGVGDHEAIVALLVETMGWQPDGTSHEVFRWKHLTNAFGASPMWIATSEGRVIALRTFMRWEFRSSEAPAGDVIRAVRAVDTVTHPDFRGGGLFRSMTTQALDELRDDGVSFIFNTPNDQSRPGYLKMGWQPVGRVPVRLTPVGLRSVIAMARAIRAAADLEPRPDVPSVGEPVTVAGLQPFVDLPTASGQLSTNRSLAYLEWRYLATPYSYRVISHSTGTAIVRLRRRGGVLEATVAEVATSQPRAFNRALLRTLRRGGAQYASLVAANPILGRRWINAQRFGPILVQRPLHDQPLDRFDLSAGDVEIF